MKENNSLVKIRKRPFKIEWTDEEDKILFSMAELDKRKSWKTISKMLNNKTPSQCFYRFHSKNSMVFKKNWTKEEDKIITEFIKIHGKKWDEVAKMLKYRTPKQIKERYLNKLDDNLVRSKFSNEEDDKIISLYLKHGSKWSFISRFFGGRTPDMIKSRFYSSLHKKILGNEDNTNRSVEYKKISEQANSLSEIQEIGKKNELNNKRQLKKNKRKRNTKTIKLKNLTYNQNLNLKGETSFNNIPKDGNNNTLTDVSFYDKDEKDSNSNSNSLTNANSNPFNNLGLPQQTNEFVEKSFTEFPSENEIVKQSINQSTQKEAVEILNNYNYFNFDNYANNYFFCDVKHNLNYYNINDQFEFISYYQKHIQENIFDILDD